MRYLTITATLILATRLSAQKAKSIRVELPIAKPAAVERVLGAIVARDLSVESSQDGIVRTVEVEKDGRQIRYVATIVATSDSTSLIQWRADVRAPYLKAISPGADERVWPIEEGTRGFVGYAWTTLRQLAAATRGDSTAAPK